MLDKLVNYLDQNKLLVILIVVLLLLIIVVMYNCSSKQKSNEHMDGTISQDPLMALPKCDPNTDQTFYKEFVGPTKLVNFKCKYNEREYYLACVGKGDCYVANPTPEMSFPDCNDIMVVLIDKEDIERDLAQYLKDIENDTKICNFKKNLECSQINKSEENCQKEYPECLGRRLFIHDFIINEVIQQPTITGIPPRRKYTIKGFAKPLRNGNMIEGTINQAVFEDFGINFLCGDNTFYSKDSGKTRYNEIIVAEKQMPVSQNIIGVSNNVVNLMMVTQEFLAGVDPETKQTVINKLNDMNGNPRLKLSYFAVCDPNKTCMMNAKQYPRVCLVEDQLDPRVLNFEPILAGSFSYGS